LAFQLVLKTRTHFITTRDSEAEFSAMNALVEGLIERKIAIAVIEIESVL
jgi:hypothetical protein